MDAWMDAACMHACRCSYIWQEPQLRVVGRPNHGPSCNETLCGTTQHGQHLLPELDPPVPAPHTAADAARHVAWLPEDGEQDQQVRAAAALPHRWRDAQRVAHTMLVCVPGPRFGLQGRLAQAYSELIHDLEGDACKDVAPGFVKALISEKVRRWRRRYFASRHCARSHVHSHTFRTTRFEGWASKMPTR